MSRKKAVRRVTAPRKDKLNYLAEILYDFLPLTSNSDSAITFTSIFADSSVDEYLKGENKTQELQDGFTQLYRYHKILPFKIIRKVIPAAKEYRKYKRRPLTREELDELAKCLYELDIDLRNEIDEVELDEELPPIDVPSDELKKRLRNHDLNKFIVREPLQLFEDGHFNEAVRKAAEIFEDEVRDISSIKSHGRDLMAKTFTDEKNLDLFSLESENKESFVEGYKFLAMGMMGSIRNVFSHGDEERREPEECFEMLLFINWLLRFLDKA